MAGTDAPALLVVSRGNHPGVDDALRRMEEDGWLRTAAHVAVAPGSGGTGAGPPWSELVEFVKTVRVEHVVLHHYHGQESPDPRPFVRAIRDQSHRPTVALTCGDPFYNGFFKHVHPKVFRDACSEVDAVFSTSMGSHAEKILSYGAPRVGLWPNGADQKRFGPPTTTLEHDSQRKFDVVFIGSNNRSRNPLRSYHWFAKRRERLVRHLAKHYGTRFAVFGHGWDGLPSAQGPVGFDRQLEVCRQAKVIVGGVPFSPARYYTSDRPFNQILSGVPFVDIRVDGVDRILRDGEHWHLVDDIGDVAAKCDELLEASDQDRDRLGRAAAAFVWENHTQEVRWRTLFAQLADLRQALESGTTPYVSDWGFLLPEARSDPERQHALLGSWMGHLDGR